MAQYSSADQAQLTQVVRMPRPSPLSLRIAMLSAHTNPYGQMGGYKVGGLNVYVQETARELARRGHRIDIFTRASDGVPSVRQVEPGVRLVQVEAGPPGVLDRDVLWEYLPAFLLGLRAFRERQGLRYDLVHSHYWMSGWAGGYLQRLWNVPHVTMFHTLGEVKNRARADEHEPPHRIHAERRIATAADAVVVATEHERALLRELYTGPSARTTVIPCGVDLGHFAPRDRTESRRLLGLGQEPVILFVGRLEPLKGLDLLIEALARVPGATLLVAGGDASSARYRRTLERRARIFGVQHRVRFAGAVDREHLPLYYSAADVCAVPSYYESFGLVALEAMACGAPVVASDVGGLPTTVLDGHNGYLVRWRSPDLWSQRLTALLSSDETRSRLRRNALTTAARFTWSRVAHDLEDLYLDLLNDRASRSCHAAGEPLTPARHVHCAAR